MTAHTSSSIRKVALAAVIAGAIAIGNAQGQQAGAGPTHAVNAKDPRVGLKAGMDDAGTAIHGLELVAHMGKPESFQSASGNLDFANSDFAFQGPHLFLGNFHGLNFYNVEDPRRPQLRVSVPCPGGQGDVSVFGRLLFMSVEQPSGRIDCGPQGVSTPVSLERFRGVRIFDISDIENPKQIAAVQTCRGSHTHTLVVPPNATDFIYVYGSGTSGVRSGDELAGCTSGSSTDDPNSSLFSIDVIQVPLKAPETAKIVNRPRIFADPATGAIAGLWMGGTHGENTQRTSTTNQCHDITTYPAVGLAAGACSGNGILLDISDPVNPKRLDAAIDKNFAYWHSASFNNDGTKVVFTDEWGGGTAPRCRTTDLLTWGADAVFNIVDKKLVFGGYYKMPAPQTDQENCVAHNGSLVPVPGRDIMVQAWYQGGLSMFDFTDAAHPVEIGYFDRGPIDEKRLLIGGYWSTYYYNGHIYGSEIYRGLDIFKLVPTEQLTQNEIDAAALVKSTELNVQHQSKITWPPSFVVAKAYLDQLVRSKTITTGRASTIRDAMDRAEKATGASKDSALAQINSMASQLDLEGSKASGIDAKRLKGAAEAMKGRAEQLK